MEATAGQSNRRQFLIGAGALVIAAGAGAAYYFWKGQGLPLDIAQDPSTPAPTTTTTASNDLMAPGPLEEMILGDPAAPVTIVEYASMSCPHCAHFHQATYPELKSRFIDTGKVRFIFREFPLDQLALAGSALARCAGKDKYFALVETLFQQQRQWVTQRPLEPLQAITRQAGMTQQQFDACLQDQTIIKGIEQIRERAADKFGVNSTPTFFINGKKYNGSMEVEDLDRELAPYLKS